MNYLLTYYDYDKKEHFYWFDTEEEMKEYVNDPEGLYDVAEVVDMLYIKECEDLKKPLWKSTKTKIVECLTCDGRGMEPHTHDVCKDCGGTGEEPSKEN